MLRLSEAGYRIYDEVAPLALAFERRLFEGMDAAERELLFRLLDRLDELEIRAEADIPPPEAGAQPVRSRSARSATGADAALRYSQASARAPRTDDRAADHVGSAVRTQKETAAEAAVSGRRDCRLPNRYFTPCISFWISGAIRNSSTPAPSSAQKPKV